VGVSAVDQPSYFAAVHHLDQIRATVRYISIEPLLGPLQPVFIRFPSYREIDWLIIGCQTPPSPVTMPKFEWVEEIVNIADRKGIPVFIKPPLSDIMNYHREEMPEH